MSEMKKIVLDLEYPDIDYFSIICHILIVHSIDFDIEKNACDLKPPCIVHIDHKEYDNVYIDIINKGIRIMINEKEMFDGRIEVLGTMFAHYLLGNDDNCKFCVIDSSKVRRKFNA